MKKIFIHKLAVKAEAQFDYEGGMGFVRIPKNKIVKEVEEYLDLKQKDDKLRNVYYFKLKYHDEVTDKMLLLFIRKDATFGTMQTWSRVGICREDDWTEELDDDGIIRGWLESKVDELPDEEDWVESLRDWQAEQEGIMEDY